MRFKPIAMLLLIAVSTAGCATEQLARNDCDWVQPIKPLRKDVLTRQTKEQIAAHNEAGKRICRWNSQSVSHGRCAISTGFAAHAGIETVKALILHSDHPMGAEHYGPELVSATLLSWAERQGIAIRHIQPAKPPAECLCRAIESNGSA